jgi:hypothetical protein
MNSSHELVKSLLEEDTIKGAMETAGYDIHDIEGILKSEELKAAHATAKEEAAKVPRLGDPEKGEYRLTKFETISLEQDSQRRGYLKITHLVNVQLPYTKNVLDFQLIQEIKPYNGGETCDIHWGKDLPKSADQLQSWLAAAAFALQVKDQMDNINQIQIFAHR